MASPSPPSTPEDRPQVSLKQKLAYGIGSLPFELAVNALKYLGNQIFNITLKMDSALVGLVFIIIRIWDAFTDPFMGNLSDNTRSKWGRRKPYVLGGAIASGIIFALIWQVPTSFYGNSQFLFIYFLAFALLHYTAVTVFQVPFNALGYEMATGYHEKTSVFAYRMCFGQIAKFLMPTLWFLCQLEIFRGDPMLGVKWVGAGVGLIIIVFILPSAKYVKEGKQEQVKTQKRISLTEAVKLTIRVKPFLILVCLTGVTIFGANFVMSLGYYVNAYHVSGGDQALASKYQMYGAWLGTAVSLISIPIFVRLSKKYGKLVCLGICMGSVAIGSGLTWWLYTPEHPYLQIVVYPFLFLGDTGFWLFVTSMKADICDWDEWKYGLRREGMYGAATGWFQKMTQAFTFGGAGIMLAFIGYDENLGADQTPESIFWMRLLYAILPAALAIVGIILLIFYPMNEKKAAEIHAELDRRRSG